MIGNSAWQAFLCGFMWGMNRYNRCILPLARLHHVRDGAGLLTASRLWVARPAWTTALGIVGSFGCGIAGAILIWQVGERSKKKAEVTRKVWEMLKKDEDEVSRPV